MSQNIMIKFPWPEFEVHLPTVKLKVAGYFLDNFLGFVTDEYSIHFDFRDILSEDELLWLQNFWASLDRDANGSEIEKQALRDAITDHVRLSLVEKEWADMTAIERKIVLAIPLTDAEKDELIGG